MNQEENKRMLALACIVADLKTENMELEQRVEHLLDDYNNVVNQLSGKDKRKGESPSKQTIGEMQQLRNRCNELMRENKKLERFADELKLLAVDSDLYIKDGTCCPYYSNHPAIGSTDCMECASFVGFIEGRGLICRELLESAEFSLPDDDDVEEFPDNDAEE